MEAGGVPTKADSGRTDRRPEFFCLHDAQAAAEALSLGAYHHFSCSFATRPVYARGRPPKNGHRRLLGQRYRMVAGVIEDRAAIEKLREEAGCFVLLTNVPADQKSGPEILRLYKDQDGVERNFGFLKDPLVANDVFLKKPRRIEAMGLVLVVALLLWRLMERAMRQKNVALPGWNNRETTRPTGFMMASKFSSVFVGGRGERRFLLRLWRKRNGRIFRRWTCPRPSSRRWTPEPAGSKLDMSPRNYPKRLPKKCEIWDKPSPWHGLTGKRYLVRRKSRGKGVFFRIALRIAFLRKRAGFFPLSVKSRRFRPQEARRGQIWITPNLGNGGAAPEMEFPIHPAFDPFLYTVL